MRCRKDLINHLTPHPPPTLKHPMTPFNMFSIYNNIDMINCIGWCLILKKTDFSYLFDLFFSKRLNCFDIDQCEHTINTVCLWNSK